MKSLLGTVLFPEEIILRPSQKSKLKKEILKERGNKCEMCPATKNLTMHHINHCKDDNRKENIKILCRECHDIVDFGKVTPNGRVKEMSVELRKIELSEICVSCLDSFLKGDIYTEEQLDYILSFNPFFTLLLREDVIKKLLYNSYTEGL
jgi:hypothetical protein